MTLLYAVLNPLVKTLLRSPFHGLLSGNTMLVQFEGRRSGKRFELPVSYAALDGELIGFTNREGKWWRNFQQTAAARLLIAGEERAVAVTAVAGDSALLEPLLAAFLKAVPRDAAPAGVKMQAGVPLPADVAAAAERLVALRYQFTTKGENSDG